DEITRREAALDKARASASSSKMETVYHSLRLRTRLALSFGRTAVAKQMASPQTKSYSIQAMEAGIDSMRDAARELEALEKLGAPLACEISSKELWEFHQRLLDIWDNAKKRDDLTLIRDIDLRKLGEELLKRPIAAK
ncbi:MAG: hypothetical protein Q7N50_07710, partial [Armatimonadota bacterium]|nr:hypothetical protein [Armatimonadota bacterium]